MMVRKAHELDMLTCPYVFDPDQAHAMAEDGADIHDGIVRWRKADLLRR